MLSAPFISQSLFLHRRLLIVKKIFTLVLLAAFAVQSFNNTLIVFNFYVTQRKIAATVCENRYRPMLHCDGKCQLAKKIKQEENKNNQNPERKPENKNEVISSKSFFITGLFVIPINNTLYKNYIEKKLSNTHPSVFHPPCA